MDSDTIFENVIPLSVKVAEASAKGSYLIVIVQWKSIYGL